MTRDIRKTYVGYDLGDGETITDLVTLVFGEGTSKTNFDNMTMPDSNEPGKAMPTIFAYDGLGGVIFSETISADPESVKNIIINFKRCPSDLIKKVESKSDIELVEMLRTYKEWPNASVWAGGNTKEMLQFRDSVIAFTNGIFQNENYIKRLETAAASSDEIVFGVGHPTKWSDLDIAIYELILKNSVLGSGTFIGKKSSIVMEAESRAAYLYSKDVEAFGRLPKGSSVLLIDVGSSTIDVTAMTASTNNHQYNSGSNYLGARSIDFMIRDWYLGELKNNPASWSMYENLVKNNPTIPNALTLACRKAKEQIYSTTAGMTMVYFGMFPGMRLKKDTLENIIDNTPIASILKEISKLPEEECTRMGSKSWKQLFKEFLTEKKAEMEKQGIKVAHIILTGSASKMPFVPQIVLEVYSELSKDALGYDMDPSRTISKGLALAGVVNDKTTVWEADLNHLIDEKLPKVIKNNIPALAKDMGKVVNGIVRPVVRGRINDWKEKRIIYLNTMNQKIKEDLSEENIRKKLESSKEYQDTLKDWLTNKVGMDVAVELKGLCDKHGVKGIEVKDLNIMMVPSIQIGGIVIDPLDFMDSLGAVMAVITGIISAVCVTTIMAIITLILAVISETLAAALFTALVSMGPGGWVVLAVVVGITVGVLVKNGFDSVKNIFQDKVMFWDLPKMARVLLKDDKINDSIAKANIPGKVEDAFKKQDVVENITTNISNSLKGLIRKRAEDIKYAIQSK